MTLWDAWTIRHSRLTKILVPRRSIAPDRERRGFERCAPYCRDIGRPSLDPELMMRMLSLATFMAFSQSGIYGQDDRGVMNGILLVTLW